MLTVPKGPVNSGATVNLTCTTETDLKSNPIWQLENEAKNEIYDGTQSTIKNSLKKSTITLSDVSKLWTGMVSGNFLKEY